jgi:hypothetical protein
MLVTPRIRSVVQVIGCVRQLAARSSVYMHAKKHGVPAPPYPAGTSLYDRVADKVGEYRGKAGTYVMLRPVGGGREWQAEPSWVREATASERLSAEVRAANDRSGKAVEQGMGARGFDVSRPPEPVSGCEECAELSGRRVVARAELDGSLETDMNVLLRRHQRADHQGAAE